VISHLYFPLFLHPLINGVLGATPDESTTSGDALNNVQIWQRSSGHSMPPWSCASADPSIDHDQRSTHKSSHGISMATLLGDDLFKGMGFSMGFSMEKPVSVDVSGRQWTPISG
jgi:hypothetical protein